MSEVDLAIFEELMAEFNVSGSLDHFIYELANGDNEHEYDDLVFPPSNGRGYSDPTWDAECDVYYKQNSDRWEAFVTKSGYEHIDQEGGGEGGAEYCYGIFKLSGKTYKAEYSYYSHQGHEYDDISSTLREVKPVEKTITVWE